MNGPVRVDQDTTRPRPWPLSAAMACIAILYLIYAFGSFSTLAAVGHDPRFGVMSATQALPELDFARFWVVGARIVWTLTGAAAFDPASEWFRSHIHIDILSASTAAGNIWLYPPTMGLLAVPFALIPIKLSFWLWRILSLLIATLTLRRAGLAWWVIGAGLACPAEIHDLVLGQTGALTAGLLIPALLCIDRKPAFSGILASLLCIKPQTAAVLPLILLHRAHRKAFAWWLLATDLFLALTLAIVGLGAWFFFLTVSQPKAAEILRLPFDQSPPGGYTMFTMARSLHASLAAAWSLQACATIFAGVWIWRLWRGETTDPTSRMALTICLATLLTPYGFQYDLVGFSIAMVAMLPRVPDIAKPVLGLCWLLGGYTDFITSHTGVTIVPAATLAAALIIHHATRPRPILMMESASLPAA